ncbi:MAG: helix-turn-helix domain-containing protein [Pseudonocardiaceae bacterium]
MAAEHGRTTRRRKLGAALQTLRNEAGMTQVAAANVINLKDSSLSRIETGTRGASVPQVMALCQLYRADPAFTEVLVQLARDAGDPSWWFAEYGSAVPDWFRGYLDLETDASEVWTYEAGCVPGLLQTPEYVQAIESVEAAKRAKLRESRQQRLHQGHPLMLRAVLDEAALRRAVGDPGVMREQIRHLAAMAGLPRVTLRILPFSAGYHPAISGSFVVLKFPAPSMDTVYIELVGGALYANKRADVAPYEMTFERLMKQALGGEETMSFLHEIERSWS